MHELQKSICEKYDSPWIPINEQDSVILIGNPNERPLYGMKIMDWDLQGNPFETWYITFGQSQDEDGQEITVQQLSQTLPEVIPFLGLDFGFQFLIEKNGDTDVWFDDDF